MIYLYGLMDPSAEDPSPLLGGLSGITGPVLAEALPEGYLLYSAHDGSRIMAKRRNLLAHTKVLEQASEWATVLPMRFGMVSDDLSEVTELVAQQADTLSGQFSRLKGLIEYGVRVAFAEEPALSHQLSVHKTLASERERLLATARGGHFEQAEFGRKLGEALERNRTDQQRALVAKLRGDVEDLIVRAPDSEYQVLNAHILVHQRQENGLGQRIADLAAELDFAPGSEPEVQLVGPAPLYNFVSLNLTSEPRRAA